MVLCNLLSPLYQSVSGCGGHLILLWLRNHCYDLMCVFAFLHLIFVRFANAWSCLFFIDRRYSSQRAQEEY